MGGSWTRRKPSKTNPLDTLKEAYEEAAER